MGDIGVGIVGTGFMGACHAQALLAVGHLCEPALRPRLELVADRDAAAAERARRRFGFAGATSDWRALVADPRVALVSITTPNALHAPIALAALAAGKHVWCEKPLGLDADEARALRDAAVQSGRVTLVGYNYLRSPAIQELKRRVDAGALGRLIDLRVAFDEDYLADPATPFSWRCERAGAGSGVLGDLGSHALALARHVGGAITAVTGALATVVAERPVPADGGPGGQWDVAAHPVRRRRVENDDLAHGLLRFASGLTGSFVASRVAWGRKNGLTIDLYGSEGAARFDQERFNELQWLHTGDAGFTRILSGPAQPGYARFNPAPGHGLGFNDLKVLEAAHLLDAIASGAPAYPDFVEGWAIEEVAAALQRSAVSGAWEPVAQA